MDKNTLSNYGWVVSVILVLAIMITLASPFGSAIKRGVTDMVKDFKNTGSDVLDDMGGANDFSDLGGGTGGAPGMGESGTPVMLEGDGQSFHKFAPTTLTFRSSAPYEDFLEVQVNGETIDPSNYTVSEGSTVVTMSAEYLASLNAEEHQVKIVSKTGAPTANFEVIEPEVNSHGFYYNQPYAAYVEYFGETDVFFIREDGTMDIIGLISDVVVQATYTAAGNTMTIVAPDFGTFTTTVSDDGMEIYCNELFTNFVLGDESVVADEDYIYIYKEDFGGYEVSAIDKTKAEYADIKTGINGIPTVKLADSMFNGNANLVKAPKIPNGVTNIGNLAFNNCSELINVIIPDSVTSVGVFAFDGCESLTSVTIGNGVASIGRGSFTDCTKLISVYYNGTLEQWCGFDFEILTSNPCSYGASLYINNKLLKDVIVPDGVTSIGNYAFYGCTSLTSVTISDGVTSIGESAFKKCTNLTSVVIPDSVTNIGNSAFYECKNLTNVVVPNGVNIIEDGTFYCCTSLTSVTIPDSVTSIGNKEIKMVGAFRECENLIEINYSGTMDQWNNVVYKDDTWDFQSGNYTIYCTDGEIPKA